MQNTFSRVFSLDATTEKKFYFVPEKSANSLRYLVHTNRDVELKKFTMAATDGTWKIQPQTVRLPEWLFTLESQFDQQIKEVLELQK
jgi:hypothetical protein